MAAAVAGRATFFAYEFSSLGITLSWDGIGYSTDELEKLWASVSTHSAAPRLRELVIALNAARTLGEVRLSAVGGEMTMNGSRVSLHLETGAAQTTLSLALYRTWRQLLRRILQRSPKALLRSRAPLAPLQLRPPLRGMLPLVVPWAIQVGRPPHASVEAVTMDQLPETEWGQGNIYLDRSASQIMQLGVHVRPPVLASPRLRICWWTETLRLDLSRESLLEDQSFQDWLLWIAGAAASTLASKTSRDQEQLNCLVDCGIYSRNSAFRGAELFVRADGAPANFDDIERQYLQEGYIPYITYRAPVPWRPERVIVCQHPHETRILRHFATVNLSLMCEKEDSTYRLPDLEEYLIRLPLPHNTGEIALRNCLTPLHRDRKNGTWNVVENAVPRACDVAVSQKRSRYCEFASTYLCLVRRDRGSIDSNVFAAHLLNFFVLCGDAVAKSESSQTLSVLLESNKPAQLSARILGLHLGTAEFKSMARECRFKCFFGPDLYTYPTRSR